MHVLRRQFDRIEGLAAFVAAAAENTVTQGVVLDINPIWLAAYRLARAGLRSGAFDLHWMSWPLLLIEELARFESIAGDVIDFDWVDPSGNVENFTRNLMSDFHKPLSTRTLPFVVKVIARPITETEAEARQQLVTLAAAQNFFALVETRPLGRLAVAAGDDCLAGAVPGTIGGFLRDHLTGDVYAVTCGHVAAKGAVVSSQGNHAGVCSYSHPPNQLSPGQVCTQGCPAASRLDLALISVANTTGKNIVTGVAPQIASRQGIMLRGGASNVNPFEVGGVALTYCPGNSNVCFENLFEVRPPSSGGILNPRLRTAFATVPTQGDSGAWVETASAAEWCGVLVATDTLMGYALEADDAISEADAVFGTRLELS
jgi:hypothetical protein